MARIKLSPIITDVRGTLGDKLTFQRRGDGHYVVKKPHPRDTQSAAQLEQRTKFLDARDAWQGLSAEDKALWNEDARAGTNMTGYAYFIQQNINAPRGLPKLETLVDRWTAQSNVFVNAVPTPATENQSVQEWHGVVNGLKIYQPTLSLRGTYVWTRPYGQRCIRLLGDYMRTDDFNLPSGTAARTVAVLAESDFNYQRYSVWNWTFTNNTGQGCALVLNGSVDFNSVNVKFDSPQHLPNTVGLHVLSAPEGAAVKDYEYTLDGVSYPNLSASTIVRSANNTQGCTFGFGQSSAMSGHVYAVALWDDYLTPEERESITPEMLLEVA